MAHQLVVYERSTPTPTSTPGAPWSAVAAGYSHTVALKSDGTLWAWGNNNNGQPGVGLEPNGTTWDRRTPTKIGSDTDWSAVAAGDDYTMALKSDGSLWAWGSNDYGQFGDGTTINRTTPTRIGLATT